MVPSYVAILAVIVNDTAQCSIAGGFVQNGLVIKHFFSVTRDFEKEKETTHKDDLLVEYLDGPNQGIVIFGLNRPKVKLKLPKTT